MKVLRNINELPDLYIVFDNPPVKGDINKGIVAYRKVHFANFWTIVDNHPAMAKRNGKICLNRSSAEAFKYIPANAPWFDTVEEMLEWIAIEIAKLEK